MTNLKHIYAVLVCMFAINGCFGMDRHASRGELNSVPLNGQTVAQKVKEAGFVAMFVAGLRAEVPERDFNEKERQYLSLK